MVRLKNRFLVVKLSCDSIPDRSALHTTLRDDLLRNFGLQMAGIALEMQVKFCDADTQLALLRVPREGCKVVRSALTLLVEFQGQRIVCDVLSTSGSIRTGRACLMKHVRNWYRAALKEALNEPSYRKEVDRLCAKMEATLSRANSIEN